LYIVCKNSWKFNVKIENECLSRGRRQQAAAAASGVAAAGARWTAVLKHAGRWWRVRVCRRDRATTCWQTPADYQHTPLEWTITTNREL